MIETDLMIATGVALAAGFLRGFVGVGSGMLMAPVFAILFGPVATVAIVTLMELVVTAQLLPSVYRKINWSLIVPMSVAAAALMPLGSWILTSVDPELMARAIALVVLIFVLLLFTGWRYHGRRRLPVTLGIGGVSGVLIAATSMGNPPVILYLLAGRDDAATNRANFTGYFAITLTSVGLLMLARELITGSDAGTAAMLLPGFMLAAWVGARCFRQSSEPLYRKVALGLLLCVAVFGLLR